MFARVLTFRFRPDEALVEQVERIHRENTPILQEQKGFVKLYQMLDKTTGKGVQIHVWDSEADLLAYLNGPVAQGLQARIQAVVKDFAIAPPEAEHYEVVGEA
ncbi:MAG TPA: antibiotic biosynthesis monooxygenase [Chloroflexia bacterium]|nr:antibiotic biosynthesis monooxygenase [Chloroflexia bacterium]